MVKPRLTYFDIPASRGEECRLALHLAGVEFDDIRVPSADWPALRPTTPYGGLPYLELPGEPVIAHSNAILVLIGRRHALHPADDVEAARHEGMMEHVEDLRHVIAPTLRLGADDKRRAREHIASAVVPEWARFAEHHVEGPFFAGDKLHVVDLKLFTIVRWLASGVLDHIPATIIQGYPKLVRVHDAVREHPGVAAWYARPR